MPHVRRQPIARYAVLWSIESSAESSEADHLERDVVCPIEDVARPPKDVACPSKDAACPNKDAVRPAMDAIRPKQKITRYQRERSEEE